jgi:hypothetical protein
MWATRQVLTAGLFVAAASSARAELTYTETPKIYTESPRTGAIELKLGGYKPLIDREKSLNGKVYDQVFGASSMFLIELEFQKFFYQGIGTAGVGFSIGYAEKYAHASVVQTDPNAPPISSPVTTSLKVLPMRLLVVYKMDYLATHAIVPLTPYVQAGLNFTPWWASKGGAIEYVAGSRGAGGKWGYGFTGGLGLLLDFFEPRLAKDFDTDIGVNHTYLFAEYTYENVNNFGKAGLDLSSRRWMFGIAFEF